MSTKTSATRVGESLWSKQTKTSAELFTLTYGVLVTQLLQDYTTPAEVNTQLELMGYNIGVRLIDDYLARSPMDSCTSFGETAEAIAKVAFKMFLGTTADVASVTPTSFSLSFTDNVLATFVELPPTLDTLAYSNLLCGVIRGSLGMINMKVSATFVKDVLRGDDVNEIRVVLEKMQEDEVGDMFKDE
jgi:hypothetical protein